MTRKRYCERGSRFISRSERRLDGSTGRDYFLRAWNDRPRPGQPTPRVADRCCQVRP